VRQCLPRVYGSCELDPAAIALVMVEGKLPACLGVLLLEQLLYFVARGQIIRNRQSPTVVRCTNCLIDPPFVLSDLSLLVFRELLRRIFFANGHGVPPTRVWQGSRCPRLLIV